MIGSVPTSIMRWIGGGIDPFQDGSANEGKGFAQQVMGRGESAAQAGGAANKNRAKDEKAQQQQAAREAKEDARSDQQNEILMKLSSGGSGSGQKDQGSH